MRQLTASIILLGIIAALLWLWHNERERSSNMAILLASTQQQVVELETKVLELESTITELKRKTPEGLLDRANRTLIDSWESFVDTVEKELNRVTDELDESVEPVPPDDSTNDADEDDISGRKRT